jgi:hypothetical protein
VLRGHQLFGYVDGSVKAPAKTITEGSGDLAVQVANLLTIDFSRPGTSVKVSWSVEGLSITSTENLSILLCVYPFSPNSLFQTPIMFSLRPGGGLRHSRWPCRPRTTLRRASPDGFPHKEAI